MMKTFRKIRTLIHVASLFFAYALSTANASAFYHNETLNANVNTNAWHDATMRTAGRYAQARDTATAQRPFEGHFVSKELGVHLYLNLYEENILVPGSEFLGKVHGYMHKGIYGTWMLIKHEIKGNKALLRFSNDIGSDSQNIEFEQLSDSLYHLRAVNGNALRKAVGRKLVKVTDEMDFKRQ